MSGSIPVPVRTAHIGVGSNLGEPLSNCRHAIQLLDGMEGCRVSGTSRFYRTEPVGALPQGWYVNAVVSLETTLRPRELLKSLLSIESAMGRVRRERWEARIIDLDILLYGEEVIREGDLIVPHPFMHERRFVLLPMMDLDPQRIHPVLRKSMAQIAEELGVEGQAVILLSDR